MCSQEAPNVNNPNKEGRDSLLLRRFQKDLGRDWASPLYVKQLSDPRVSGNEQLLVEFVFDNYIKVIFLWH